MFRLGDGSTGCPGWMGTSFNVVTLRRLEGVAARETFFRVGGFGGLVRQDYAAEARQGRPRSRRLVEIADAQSQRRRMHCAERRDAPFLRAVGRTARQARHKHVLALLLVRRRVLREEESETDERRESSAARAQTSKS